MIEPGTGAFELLADALHMTLIAAGTDPTYCVNRAQLVRVFETALEAGGFVLIPVPAQPGPLGILSDRRGDT
jgi:hypothetical protein